MTPPTEEQVAARAALLDFRNASRLWRIFDGWTAATEAERRWLCDQAQPGHLAARVDALRAAQAASLGQLPLDIPAGTV